MQHKLSNEWSHDMVWGRIQKLTFWSTDTMTPMYGGWDHYEVHQPNYFTWFVFYIGNGHFWTGDLRKFFLTSPLQLEALKDKDISNFRHWERLERKYSITGKRLNVIIEEMKLRITAIAAKIRKYQGRVDSYKQNRLFENNQRQFYRE